MKETLKDYIKKNVLLKPQKENNYHVIDHDGTWIFDFRKGFLNPNILEKCCEYFWDRYEKEYPFQVGGIESGGIPFITGIILEGKKRGYKDINSFYIRKKRKEKGLGNIIEGNLSDEKILLVDDVSNGGDSLYRMFTALKNIEKHIFKCFVFVNFGNPRGQEVVENNNINLEYLFTLSDFGLGDYVAGGFTNFPIIYPKLKKFFTVKSQNLFLQTLKSNFILKDSKIYFGGESGDFYCISKDTGDIIWSISLPKTKGHKNILSSPIFYNNEIIFGNYDGNLYFLDADSGKINYIMDSIADFIGSSPALSIEKEVLYIGLEHASATTKGSFMAINYNTKEILWDYRFFDFVHCSPISYNNGNYGICGGNDGNIIGVSNNGEVKFNFQLDAPIKGSFVSDKNNIYFGSHDNYFYCINFNGNINWRFKTDNIIYTKPLLFEENICFGGLDKSFYHLSTAGNLIKKIETNGKIFGEPILIEKNVVCFASNDGFIYFYDLEKLSIKYTIYHGEKINNKMFYEETTGFLYVYDYVGCFFKYFLKKYLG